MRIEIKMCDLCYQDGMKIKAIGEYFDQIGNSHDVCKKHLEDVKKANLSHFLFEKKEA